MTHHRGPPATRPAKPRRFDVAAEAHFDADELRQRLCAVQTQQRLQASAQRRLRAAALNAVEGPHDSDARTSRRKEAKGLSVDAPAGAVQPIAKPSRLSSGNLITELRRSTSARLALRRAPKTLVDGPTPERGQEEAVATYRHIPQEAASQFIRTATAHGLREGHRVHKLSRTAVDYHLEGVKTDRSAPGDLRLPPTAQAGILRHDQKQRQSLLERNQFQRTRIIEDAAELDKRRGQEESRYAPTFEGELAKLKAEHPLLRLEVHRQVQGRRRNTTVEMAAALSADGHAPTASAMMVPMLDVVEIDGPPELSELFPPRQEHRADWTQMENVSRRSSLFPPILRKPLSRWTIKPFRTGKASSPPTGDVLILHGSSTLLALSSWRECLHLRRYQRANILGSTVHRHEMLVPFFRSAHAQGTEAARPREASDSPA